LKTLDALERKKGEKNYRPTAAWRRIAERASVDDGVDVVASEKVWAE
jgi:hypothetical protein